MNPLDLRGPDFLEFFFVLTLIVVVAVVVVRRRLETGPIPKLNAVDPYLIAYLRSGGEEAIRVAIVSLVDRGVLEHDAGFMVVGKVAPEHVQRPLEKEILAAASTPRQPIAFLAVPEIQAAAAALGDELVKLGLLPGPEHRRRRLIIAAAATGFLWCVATVKIVVAVSRGHSNVAYLILLALLGSIGAIYFAFRGRRTVVGTRLVGDLQTLFGGLRERTHEIPAGGATNELALLAGIFGLPALQGSALAPTVHLFPAPAPAFAGPRKSTWTDWSSSSSSSTSSCSSSTSTDWTSSSHTSTSSCSSSTTSCGSSSSSCSSSSGSSCGSSCGGGGGGCGGCGS